MKTKNWLFAGALGGAAAILYFASLAGYAFPGESAQLMVYWKGLDVPDVPVYPLMAFFAKLLGGGNLIAPVCGVVSAVLMFLLVSAFIAGRVTGEATESQKTTDSLVAAFAATFVFVLTPAVRSAATHLEPRLFDFTWALAAFALSLPFLRLKAAPWLFAALLGAMTGLGVCDTALFLMLSPFYIALVVFVSTAAGRKPYLPLFLLLASFFVTVLVFLGRVDIEVADFLKGVANEMSSYTAAPGWMFIAFFATLPFVTALFSSARAFSESPGVVQWTFHVAMTFVAILSVATQLSPSAIMAPYGRFPVTTSAYAAVLCGYLMAYWWHHRKSAVALVAGGIFAFVLVVTCCWNLFTFDGERGAFADHVARKIVEDLGDRRWFVSDGTLDSHVKLVAAESDKDVHVVALSRDLDEKYLSRLADVVREEGVGGDRNGELQLSLTLGVLPFLQDWFAADPEAAKGVAIWGAPDIWYSANITPVPEFLFFGCDEKRVPDWTAWAAFDKILDAPKGWGSYHDRKVTDPIDRLRFALRRHLGFVANNRGVWLQDKHRDDDAWKMYELVLNEIDHDNICSIFNEVGMVGAKHPQAVAKQRDLERMLRAAVDDTNRRYILWRLGAYYGYIRSPEIFIRLGHAWARSGRPGDALSQIRRAIDFVPTDKRAVLLNMMAALYASDNNQKQSRQIYESLLSKNSRDHDALIGMMRLELLDGNSAKALEYLQRAAESSGDGKRAKIELAMVAMMKNNLAEAKNLVKKATDSDPKDLQCWSLLAAVTIQQIDAEKDAKKRAELQKDLENVILPTMEKQSGGVHDYYIQATRGFVLLKKGEEKRREARDAFLAASKARPDVAATQNLVLGLDISMDDKDGAETHAKDVLRRNRSAPLANYVMGSLALGRGEIDDAVMYLRKAADAQQPVPLALNDIAEALRRRRDYAEAERYARKAVKAAPSLYVAWETLGAVLMDQGTNLDEAESCIRKACDLSKSKNGREADIRMLISLARVQIKRGDKQHAKISVRKVQSRIDELSAFERREFEEVKKRVR